MNFIVAVLATFMVCWLLGCLVPGFPPHWRVALLTIPVVAFILLSVPPHYSRYVSALAVGAVVMLGGKLVEHFLGVTPTTWRIRVPRVHIYRRRRGDPRGKRFTPDETAPRRRSEIPPL